MNLAILGVVACPHEPDILDLVLTHSLICPTYIQPYIAVNFGNHNPFAQGNISKYGSSCIRISDDFQQYKFGNYNPFAQENIITGADRRTKIFGLNSMEKHISQL